MLHNHVFTTQLIVCLTKTQSSWKLDRVVILTASDRMWFILLVLMYWRRFWWHREGCWATSNLLVVMCVCGKMLQWCFLWRWRKYVYSVGEWFCLLLAGLKWLYMNWTDKIFVCFEVSWNRYTWMDIILIGCGKWCDRICLKWVYDDDALFRSGQFDCLVNGVQISRS